MQALTYLGFETDFCQHVVLFCLGVLAFSPGEEGHGLGNVFNVSDAPYEGHGAPGPAVIWILHLGRRFFTVQFGALEFYNPTSMQDAYIFFSWGRANPAKVFHFAFPLNP